MICPSCNNLRYLHIEYDTSGTFEIEACDECKPKGFDDGHAAVLHRVLCGCPCPENADWRNHLYEDESVGTMLPVATFSLLDEALRLLAGANLDPPTLDAPQKERAAFELVLRSDEVVKSLKRSGIEITL